MTWLTRLYLKWRNRTDSAWKPTGYAYRFDGHDEAKAVQAATRAAVEAENRRLLAAQRCQPAKAAQKPKRAENVVAMRKVAK